MPVLDDRLSRAAALFPACAYGADIGADHGRLSCYLLKTGKCERMCVADISTDSLNKARRYLASEGVAGRADFSVGDGLSVLEKPAQAIAILGMGGHTLSGILLDGADRLNGASLILSAHTDIGLVRQTLMGLDYRISAEQIAFAARHYYIIMRADPGNEALTEKQITVGPRLMEGSEEYYPSYLAWRIKGAEKKRSERGKQELVWYKEEYARVCDGKGN